MVAMFQTLVQLYGQQITALSTHLLGGVSTNQAASVLGIVKVLRFLHRAVQNQFPQVAPRLDDNAVRTSALFSSFFFAG